MTTDKDTAVTLKIDSLRFNYLDISTVAATAPVFIQGDAASLSGFAYAGSGTTFPFEARLTFQESAELETALAKIAERILREGVVYIAKEPD
jgi:hypothetical protein